MVREHHPRTLVGGNGPHVVFEHEALRESVVAGHCDGTGGPQPTPLPQHRVGVHVGAGLGDAEPGQVAHLGPGESTGDGRCSDLDVRVDGDERTGDDQPHAALIAQDQEESEAGDEPTEHDAGPCRLTGRSMSVAVYAPADRFQDAPTVER